MSAVVWVAALSIAVLAFLFLRAVTATYRQAAEQLERLMKAGLADVDCARWDSEMNQ